MKKATLKQRDWYGYTVIKNIFAYYAGNDGEFNGDVFLAHLQLLRLLTFTDSISDKEYRRYKRHLHRASSAMNSRYIANHLL